MKNDLKILDHLFEGHSCDNCGNLMCEDKNGICVKWKQLSATGETLKMLSKSIGIPTSFLMPIIREDAQEITMNDIEKMLELKTELKEIYESKNSTNNS